MQGQFSWQRQPSSGVLTPFTRAAFSAAAISVIFAAPATAAFAVAFHFRLFPLGVPGELEIARLSKWDVPSASWAAMLPAAGAAGALVLVVARALPNLRSAKRSTFILTLAACMALGSLFQLALEIAAPHGLQRWAVLYHGFRTGAAVKFSNVSDVLKNHARAIASMPPSHVSANPAGWIVVYRSLLDFFTAHPDIARMTWNIEPHEIAWQLRATTGLKGATPADHATITTVAIGSRIVAWLIGLPVGWLAAMRFGRPAAVASTGAVYLLPVAASLAPGHDTVYPTFAALAVALSYRATWSPAADGGLRSRAAAFAAGIIVGTGLLFSLCFLVVAMLCVLMVAFRTIGELRPTAWIAALAAIFMLGVLLAAIMLPVAFGHHAWESWAVNLAKNHEFNAYCGCTRWKWLLVNMLEFGGAMGVPAAVFLIGRTCTGLRLGRRPAADGNVDVNGNGDARRRSRTDRSLLAAWLLTVAALDLAGTNLGEVSRLWLFLMPIGLLLAVEWVDFGSNPTRQPGQSVAFPRLRVGLLRDGAHCGQGSRQIVVAFLLLQAFNCILLARELVLLWPVMPKQTQEQYSGARWTAGEKTWREYRRLSDWEIARRGIGR